MVPTPASVNTSSSNECGTRPSMITAASTPRFTASMQFSTLGIMPPEIVPGVLDKNGNLIQDMTVEQARALIADGTISGGMIPKVENCIDAVNRGVEAAVIMDGRVAHCLLLEVFTESGLGTMVKRGGSSRP